MEWIVYIKFTDCERNLKADTHLKIFKEIHRKNIKRTTGFIFRNKFIFYSRNLFLLKDLSNNGIFDFGTEKNYKITHLQLY
jgi:hypothetical protein